MSLHIGTQLGTYEIIALLGKGGMGEVWKARDKKLGREVAIKILPDDLVDTAARRRFQREAQMASSLNHPHILTVYDADEFEGRQYLVTEFVDGGTLSDWVKAEKRGWRQVLEILVGVADGLATAHGAGITHRDIKPANILVAHNGYAKLVDFGLAKLTDPNNTQMKTMIQKLVADRFQLKFHREKKELSVYAVTVGKTGSKLTASQSDPNALPSLLFGALGRLTARNATMQAFAEVMQRAAMDRPVLDQTGLTGKYDFTLNWTPDEFQFATLRNPNAPPTPPPPNGAEFPDLYTAIQQQLGLELKSTKGSVDVLVIDRVEKPSEN